jgi:hypothetical protein
MTKDANLLNEIQQKLKAPKGQFNAFGKYKYRNAEDILEAVKPLLGNGTLIISDEIVQIGDRYYVRATATLATFGNTWSASAFARESLDKKGMDEAQITGAASSYARKYALNGLFCIDDTKDADNEDNTQKKMTPYKVEKKKVEPVDEEAVMNRDEIHAVQKEEIKALLIALDYERPTAKTIKLLTNLEPDEENYTKIIEILKAKVDAHDPISGVIQNAE